MNDSLMLRSFLNFQETLQRFINEDVAIETIRFKIKVFFFFFFFHPLPIQFSYLVICGQSSLKSLPRTSLVQAPMLCGIRHNDWTFTLQNLMLLESLLGKKFSANAQDWCQLSIMRNLNSCRLVAIILVQKAKMIRGIVHFQDILGNEV